MFRRCEGEEIGPRAIEVDSGEEKHLSYGVVNVDVRWLEAEVKGMVLACPPGVK